MHVFVTGGSGFVGTHLTRYLLSKKYRVTAVGRSSSHFLKNHDHFTYFSADTMRPGPWQNALKGAHVVINLAGTSIFSYWSPKNKTMIRDSRLITTRHVVDALEGERHPVLISASGVGYYGARGDREIDEDEPPGRGMLAQLAADWEMEAAKAAEKGARVACMRLGVVLGRGGGAMARMAPAFRYFLGGPIGSGRQWFPWIHMLDLIKAIEFIIDQPEIKGPLNFCAPQTIRQSAFAKTLAQVMNRPAILPMPATVLRILLGEASALLLQGQRTIPKKLIESGFQFDYPDLFSALKDLV